MRISEMANMVIENQEAWDFYEKHLMPKVDSGDISNNEAIKIAYEMFFED